MTRCVALGLAMLSLAAQAVAQETQDERSIFVMGDRPSLRFGDVFRLEPITKFDALVWRSDLDPDGSEFSFDRRRIGVQGRLFRVVEFEIERELGDDETPWRDVVAELRKWRAVRVKGGRFKIPFGEERLTSIASLDFINRSLASEALTPGRDTGLELNGRLFDSVLSYKAGIFQHDGDVSRAGTDAPAERTGAGTLTVAPFAHADSKALKSIEFGGAAAVGDVPEGLNGLRARTVGGYEAIAPHFVAGRRIRLGAHAGWSGGPVAIRGEYLQARDERKGQSLAGDDLPDVIGRGGYVSGVWTAIGELKGGGPKQGLNAGRPGAIQFAGRMEWLGFASPAGIGEPLRNQRASNVMRNDLRAATLGVNWYPIRFVKLQFNFVRETLGDPERSPNPANPVVYSRVFRVQFAM
jgi:phosphate-selective porin